ncbi:MAG TPA: hypothetical protein VFF04_06460 [Candidatus Babeliales bacterium]|nr:hypothetical protein [Candidatus Babeliales bacterium]
MKKTLLEVAHEMASGLHKAGVIDDDKMHEFESLCVPKCKLSHVPNAETCKAMEEADKGIGLTKFKNLEEFFKDLDSDNIV